MKKISEAYKKELKGEFSEELISSIFCDLNTLIIKDNPIQTDAALLIATAICLELMIEKIDCDELLELAYLTMREEMEIKQSEGYTRH